MNMEIQLLAQRKHSRVNVASVSVCVFGCIFVSNKHNPTHICTNIQTRLGSIFYIKGKIERNLERIEMKRMNISSKMK